MKRQDWLNIGSPLTWNCLLRAIGIDAAEDEIQERLPGGNRCLQRLPLRLVPARHLSTAACLPPSASTRIPSISRTGPETLVKFPFSSCSQYQSEASSVRLR